MHCKRECTASQTPGEIEEKDDKALRRAIRLFLLLGLGTLDLGSAAEGLLAVLALLALGVVSERLGGMGVTENVRCWREAFSILEARPTRTRR